MGVNTITLESEAYERLCSEKRPDESFSELVLRAVFPTQPPTGADLLKYFESGESVLSEEFLDSVEKASKWDPIQKDPWA